MKSIIDSFNRIGKVLNSYEFPLAGEYLENVRTETDYIYVESVDDVKISYYYIERDTLNILHTITYNLIYLDFRGWKIIQDPR